MQFLNPNVFYMMLIPLLLLIILILTSKEMLEEHFSKQMLEKLRVGNSVFSKKGRNVFLFLTLIFFIIALARPVANEKNNDITQKLIPIVIALDVSRSMQVEDIYPNRIEFAKKKLKSFIAHAKNATIGVILFAKDSFVLSPVTEDFLSLNFIVNNLDTNINFPNGSNIFATLEATKYMLEDFNVKNLVILSDGANKDNFEEELSFAKENKIDIYAMGIGTKKGAAIPDGKNGYLTDKDGNIVTVKLNDNIKELATKSGGGYIDYTLDDSDIKAILERINLQSKKETLTKQNIKTYTELFYFPLAFGVIFLLIALSSIPSFHKKENIVAVFVLILLSSLPISSYAYEFDFEKIKKAKELYKEKKYNEAADQYRAIRTTPESLYNLGNSLYKEKKYDKAIDMFSKIVTDDIDLEAKKLHNLGNSYVQKNKLQKAKEFYEKALKVKFDKQTKENLDMVNKALKDQNKQKQQNKKDNQDQKDQKKDQKKQDQQDQKDQQKNSDKKKEEQNKQEQDQEKQQKDQNKQNQKPQQAGQSNEKQNQKRDENISQLEEEKWMKQLQNKNKAPILIQKVPTKNKENSDAAQPW
jgi:Ca-activated chloride channel homolog